MAREELFGEHRTRGQMRPSRSGRIRMRNRFRRAPPSKPSAAPIMNRARARRRRANARAFCANCVEDSVPPFVADAPVCSPTSGILPPVSGSSLTLVGQTIRFR